ncbi:MAG: hypothetical protein AAGJ51_13315, partial [Pseudomonadota bacterium]
MMISAAKTGVSTNAELACDARGENISLYEGDAIEGIIKVLLGEFDAAYIRDGIDNESCTAIVERFKSSPGISKRTDGVPADEVGATQYDKTPEEYARESVEIREEVDRILGGYDSPLKLMIRNLATELKKHGYFFRPAIVSGEAVARGRFVRWVQDTDTDFFLLRPHDDWAQTQSQ